MKLLQTLAFSVTVALAAGVQGQQVLPAKASGIISFDLLRQPLRPKASQMLQKAQRAADAGDHARAIALLETARAKYPESDAWTQSMLGVEYLKTDQFSAAAAALEKAVLLLPRNAVDHSNLGLALAHIGRFDRAEREVRLALELDGGDHTTQRLLEIV